LFQSHENGSPARGYDRRCATVLTVSSPHSASRLSNDPHFVQARMRRYERAAKQTPGANLRRAFCVSYRHFGDTS